MAFIKWNNWGKNDKTCISEIFEFNGEKTSNPQIIADGFCKYFSEVGQNFANAIPKPKKPYTSYLNHSNQNSFFMAPTDPDEVDKIISSLQPKKSSGLDNISTHFIKQTKLELKMPLSILFKIINKSLVNGLVPNNMKIAKVIPLYKGKNTEQCTNYRPISLLPSFSKILEKIVHRRL